MNLDAPINSYSAMVTKLQQLLRPLLIIHLAATFFMVGLIWTIHTVHYPLFAFVGSDSYVQFQAEHVNRIGPLLFLPWLTEGATLLALLLLAFVGGRKELRIPSALNALGMAVVLVISGFWSAPAHGDLADGFDAVIHDRLMNANFVRTIAWTICGAAAIWSVVRIWSASQSETATTHKS